MHIPKSPLGFYMCPPSFAFYQDLWRPQTRDRGGCNHFEYVPHSGSRIANQLASNQWHIWTPHTEPISEEVWQLVMSLNAHEDEQRCRENHLLGSCEHGQRVGWQNRSPSNYPFLTQAISKSSKLFSHQKPFANNLS